MILNNTPDNEAILSNVNGTGEFRIRNSAKAFAILSSGLYANKIRAVIRELSCNAVDSHVAAGKGDVPFEVHLPHALEPWLAIRDFGIGLSKDQVFNIYTTYFESTKTESNAFIGALGLGSKSPFSYTDNFTITAIKDGRKGIYTAFLNDVGVPSIATMGEEIETDESNGVEVRIAVGNRNDFYTFQSEAREVYKHFKLRPKVTGVSDFQFTDPEFKERDIVPGVHYLAYGYSHSFAIMGNIEYPIDIPQSKETLGELHKLLQCGLLMEFDIGELDFQASREGLSYIPSTIAAIKKKLQLLNANLTLHLAEKADAIKNKWDRAIYLQERARENLWQAAVKKYVKDNNFTLLKVDGHYSNPITFELLSKDLAEKYNMTFKTFEYSRYQNHTKNRYSHQVYDPLTKKHVPASAFHVGPNTQFVINDTSIGAMERARYHWRTEKRGHGELVHIIEAVDATKPIQIKAFFKAIGNPPLKQIHRASELKKRERATGLGKNVSILVLEQREQHGWHQKSKDMVWRDAGKLGAFDDTKTYYYVPLSGFTPLGFVTDMKRFSDALRSTGIYTDKVYGVRKSDIDAVKTQKNWVNIDTLVVDKLKNFSDKEVMGAIKSVIDFGNFYRYTASILKDVDVKSPYIKFYNEFKDVETKDSRLQDSLEFLCNSYGVTAGKVKITELTSKYKQDMDVLEKRYPLLNEVGGYVSNNEAIYEYINAIDLMKGY